AQAHPTATQSGLGGGVALATTILTRPRQRQAAAEAQTQPPNWGPLSHLLKLAAERATQEEGKGRYDVWLRAELRGYTGVYWKSPTPPFFNGNVLVASRDPHEILTSIRGSRAKPYPLPWRVRRALDRLVRSETPWPKPSLDAVGDSIMGALKHAEPLSPTKRFELVRAKLHAWGLTDTADDLTALHHLIGTPRDQVAEEIAQGIEGGTIGETYSSLLLLAFPFSNAPRSQAERIRLFQVPAAAMLLTLGLSLAVPWLIGLGAGVLGVRLLRLSLPSVARDVREQLARLRDLLARLEVRWQWPVVVRSLQATTGHTVPVALVQPALVVSMSADPSSPAAAASSVSNGSAPAASGPAHQAVVIHTYMNQGTNVEPARAALDAALQQLSGPDKSNTVTLMLTSAGESLSPTELSRSDVSKLGGQRVKNFRVYASALTDETARDAQRLARQKRFMARGVTFLLSEFDAALMGWVAEQQSDGFRIRVVSRGPTEDSLIHWSRFKARSADASRAFREGSAQCVTITAEAVRHLAEVFGGWRQQLYDVELPRWRPDGPVIALDFPTALGLDAATSQGIESVSAERIAGDDLLTSDRLLLELHGRRLEPEAFERWTQSRREELFRERLASLLDALNVEQQRQVPTTTWQQALLPLVRAIPEGAIEQGLLPVFAQRKPRTDLEAIPIALEWMATLSLPDALWQPVRALLPANFVPKTYSAGQAPASAHAAYDPRLDPNLWRTDQARSLTRDVSELRVVERRTILALIEARQQLPEQRFASPEQFAETVGALPKAKDYEREALLRAATIEPPVAAAPKWLLVRAYVPRDPATEAAWRADLDRALEELDALRHDVDLVLVSDGFLFGEQEAFRLQSEGFEQDEHLQGVARSSVQRSAAYALRLRQMTAEQMRRFADHPIDLTDGSITVSPSTRMTMRYVADTLDRGARCHLAVALPTLKSVLLLSRARAVYASAVTAFRHGDLDRALPLEAAAALAFRRGYQDAYQNFFEIQLPHLQQAGHRVVIVIPSSGDPTSWTKSSAAGTVRWQTGMSDALVQPGVRLIWTWPLDRSERTPAFFAGVRAQQLQDLLYSLLSAPLEELPVSRVSLNTALVPLVVSLPGEQIEQELAAYLKQLPAPKPSKEEAAVLALRWLRTLVDRGQVSAAQWQALVNVYAPALDLRTLEPLPPLPAELAEALLVGSSTAPPTFTTPQGIIIYSAGETAVDFKEIRPVLDEALERFGPHGPITFVLPNDGLLLYDEPSGSSGRARQASYREAAGMLRKEAYFTDPKLLSISASGASVFGELKSRFEIAVREHPETADEPIEVVFPHWKDTFPPSEFTRAVVAYIRHKRTLEGGGFQLHATFEDVSHETRTIPGAPRSYETSLSTLHLSRERVKRRDAFEALKRGEPAQYLADAEKARASLQRGNAPKRKEVLTKQLPGLLAQGHRVIFLSAPNFFGVERGLAPAGLARAEHSQAWTEEDLSIPERLSLQWEALPPAERRTWLLKEALARCLNTLAPASVSARPWHRAVTAIVEAVPTEQVESLIGQVFNTLRPTEDLQAGLIALVWVRDLREAEGSFVVPRETLQPLTELLAPDIDLWQLPVLSVSTALPADTVAAPPPRPSGTSPTEPSPPPALAPEPPRLTPVSDLTALGLHLGGAELPANASAFASLFGWHQLSTIERQRLIEDHQKLIEAHRLAELLTPGGEADRKIRDGISAALQQGERVGLISANNAGRQRLTELLREHDLALVPLVVGNREDDTALFFRLPAPATQPKGKPWLTVPSETVHGWTSSMVAELFITEQEPNLLRTPEQRAKVFPAHYPKGKPEDAFPTRRAQLIRRNIWPDGIEPVVFQLVRFVAPWLEDMPVSYEQARAWMLDRSRSASAEPIVTACRTLSTSQDTFNRRFQDAFRRLEQKRHGQHQSLSVIDMPILFNQLGVWELMLRDLHWSMRLDLVNGDWASLAARAKAARLVHYLWDLSVEAPATPQAQAAASVAAKEWDAASADVASALDAHAGRVSAEAAAVTSRLQAFTPPFRERAGFTQQDDEAFLTAVAQTTDGIELLPALVEAARAVAGLKALSSPLAFRSSEAVAKATADLADAERMVREAPETFLKRMRQLVTKRATEIKGGLDGLVETVTADRDAFQRLVIEQKDVSQLPNVAPIAVKLNALAPFESIDPSGAGGTVKQARDRFDEVVGALRARFTTVTQQSAQSLQQSLQQLTKRTPEALRALAAQHGGDPAQWPEMVTLAPQRDALAATNALPWLSDEARATLNGAINVYDTTLRDVGKALVEPPSPAPAPAVTASAQPPSAATPDVNALAQALASHLTNGNAATLSPDVLAALAEVLQGLPGTAPAPAQAKPTAAPFSTGPLVPLPSAPPASVQPTLAVDPRAKPVADLLAEAVSLRNAQRFAEASGHLAQTIEMIDMLRHQHPGKEHKRLKRDLETLGKRVRAEYRVIEEERALVEARMRRQAAQQAESLRLTSETVLTNEQVNALAAFDADPIVQLALARIFLKAGQPAMAAMTLRMLGDLEPSKVAVARVRQTFGEVAASLQTLTGQETAQQVAFLLSRLSQKLNPDIVYQAPTPSGLNNGAQSLPDPFLQPLATKGWWGVALYVLLTVLAIPIGEEYLFREWTFTALAPWLSQTLGTWLGVPAPPAAIAWVISVPLYVLLHPLINWIATRRVRRIDEAAKEVEHALHTLAMALRDS
ncbi:MAG TPA: hypothetical protein DD714_06980, partial [Candidatus Omnitrophica bacterium]|nr:hypothetical protein [Candidatus Omnitrophota bacterium]